MSSTTSKNILLSQAKVGQCSEEASVSILPHTISQDEIKTVVKVEIPGIDPTTVHVSCSDNFLRVECEKGYYAYPLDPTTDLSKITADIQWGMLTLSIPKPAAPAAKVIKINLHDTPPKKESSKVTAEV